MTFEPEHFHFSLAHEKNFLAYARMRLIGASLTKENFFEKVFRPAGEKLDSEIMQIFTDLPGTQEMHANIGLDSNRDYEKVLHEIQLGYEYHYDLWRQKHEALEKVVLNVLCAVSDNNAHMRSPHWKIPDDVDSRVCVYGCHCGFLLRIADQFFVRPRLRKELLSKDYPPTIRVQIAVAPNQDFTFATLRRAF
ncbi:hypothetical protein JA33_020 [Dickeya phage vB_DsoM_JA33]|uniref:Uncharacterized protein n=3 Tax=Salmondvirus JA11 TaxID=2734141 RepID=A0A384ZW14_9CAUD|nr:hypothetical protein HOU32_gp020 [Dickeya phage vB_DsoM_JA11]AXG66424.1 hypothetical protein JA13_021 [Dickeya phage vB_DsoM_JA13]AXG67394.1 hypothetical protein JA33_020 [Dickeya phage vB_DsoM_JA33]AYD79825.1 hypothetical protein JA11_020 [Dickeya phage vB_DsoM_JA11]